MLNAPDPRLADLRDAAYGTVSAMLAPLDYGMKNLGVLAIANGPLGSHFTESDFAVFKAIAGQSVTITLTDEIDASRGTSSVPAVRPRRWLTSSRRTSCGCTRTRCCPAARTCSRPALGRSG